MKQMRYFIFLLNLILILNLFGCKNKSINKQESDKVKSSKMSPNIDTEASKNEKLEIPPHYNLEDINKRTK